MPFTLPDLPYAKSALEPHISKRTLDFHHDKHHAAYVETLNELTKGTELADLSVEEVIQQTADSTVHRKIFNNAGQHWNHSFFWRCMSPDGGGRPPDALAGPIQRDFGGYDRFREKFISVSKDRFGSGWSWLVADAGKLAVISTANGEPPTVSGRNALLACDLWEHAYYLDYQNRREDFVAAFLDHVANWEFAAEQLRLEGEGSYVGARLYDEAVERHARSGRVASEAKAARAALDGPEGEELRRAEERGRAHARKPRQARRRS